MSEIPGKIHPLYAHFDPDDLQFDQLSLCLECAKHDSLKRFIQRNSVQGPVCGLCEQMSYAYPVCDLTRIHDLVNIIKSLLRFYYNEYEYNGHWGADEEPEGLLSIENPIIESVTTDSRTRDPDRTSEFFYNIFSQEPYPPVDKGVSLYAGHDGAIRMLQFSIKDKLHPALAEFRARLRSENYFHVEPDVLERISKFSARITRVIHAGSRYYRARIGIEGRYIDSENSFGWKSELLYQPLSGGKLGAPPPQLASAGRLNRAGISFLYLASDADTAASEVRPHPSHNLSVGQFENIVDLKIAYFDPDIADFSGNEFELDNYHFIHSADQLMSLPVTPEDNTRYSITQLIADCCRQMGFDGVSFKSSVGSGDNLCVFDPEKFVYVDNSSTVIQVKSLTYELASKPSISVPGPRHRLVE